MSQYLDWPDYVIFALLLVIYGMIGFYYGLEIHLKKCFKKFHKRSEISLDSTEVTRFDDDVFLGKRQLGLIPITASTMAGFLSAVTLLGNNSEVYLYGIEYVWIVLGFCISFPVTAEVYAPIFYNLRLTSGHEYLELRFSRSLRRLVTLVYTFQMIVYMAVVLYAPSLAVSRVTGWPIYVSIITSGMIATFYTALGGLRAVVWTDTIQVIVMFIGIVLLFVFGCQQVGGIERVWEIAWRDHRLNLIDFDPNPFMRHTFWTIVIGGAGMSLSIYATNQTQIQRYLACKDLKTTRRAIHLQLPLNALFLPLQLALGLVTYAVFVGCDPRLDGQISAYDQIFPHFVMVIFAHIPALRGLFLATIFAAALSSLSSGINGIACVLVEDVFLDVYLMCCKNSKLKQRTLNCISRFLAILFGLLVVGLAILLQVVPAGVLQTAISIFGALGGPILTVFTLGMIFPCINKWGALCGFLASLVTGLTMIVGSLFKFTFREHVLVPVTNASCPVANFTNSPIGTNSILAPPPQYEFSFFNLSYLYLTPFCLLVGVVVSIPVSFTTGWSSKTPVSQSLMAVQAVWLYSKLPSFGKPQSISKPVFSLHCSKMAEVVAANHSSGCFSSGSSDDDEGDNQVKATDF